MMRFSFVGLAVAGLTAAAGPATFEGLKIVVAESFSAGMTETTEYVAGDRARVEGRISSGTHEGQAERQDYVHIRRCDLDKMIILDARAHTYQSGALRAELTRLDRAILMLGRRDRDSHRGSPDIIVETNTVDTGERRAAFGRRARRVVTTRRQFRASKPDTADQTVTDGWYIDVDTRLSCERDGRHRAVLIAVPTGSNGRSPRVVFKDIGPQEEGFPIETTITSYVTGRGELPQIPPVITRRIVTHLSRELFEASLFELPRGFRSKDPRFSNLAAGWSRKAHIIRSVVASWFR
jgi:hypothetical protein